MLVRRKQLYRVHVKIKSPKVLDRYKRYENKLTSIIKFEEKKYYTFTLSSAETMLKLLGKS